jgi:hypothetical protein
MWQIVWLLGLMVVSGCGSAPAVNRQEQDHLGTLFAAYTDARAKLGHPPQSLEELQPHLAKYGIGAEALVSPRDGQPYVIVWSVDLNDPANLSPPAAIAYEAQGADGQRVVLTVMGIARMTDDEFRKLKLPPRPETRPPGTNP